MNTSENDLLKLIGPSCPSEDPNSSNLSGFLNPLEKSPGSFGMDE